MGRPIRHPVRGRRQINVDLKDIQDQRYRPQRFESALRGSDLAALWNINFARPFLVAARQRRVPIATDVHAVSDLDDPCNQDLMAAADILFMSDELLATTPQRWAEQVLARYAPEVLVIGMGERGALLAIRDENRLLRLEPIYTRPVVDTIGVGDALFSAFIHLHARALDPVRSLERAMVFASFKLGEEGAADGFLTEDELERWVGRVI